MTNARRRVLVCGVKKKRSKLQYFSISSLRKGLGLEVHTIKGFL